MQNGAKGRSVTGLFRSMKTLVDYIHIYPMAAIVYILSISTTSMTSERRGEKRQAKSGERIK